MKVTVDSLRRLASVEIMEADNGRNTSVQRAFNIVLEFGSARELDYIELTHFRQDLCTRAARHNR